MKIFIVLILFFYVLSVKYDPNQIIEKVNSKQTSWVAGSNSRFEGMDMQTIRSMMGTFILPRFLMPKQRQFDQLILAPDSFDARQQWSKCQSIKEIRDQSNCGSCWAFGAVQSMSDRICIKSGQQKQVKISAQDLLDCCSICGFGCNGGFPLAAWGYFELQGIVTGNLYGDTQWCKPYSLKPCDHHSTGKYQPCQGNSKTPRCQRHCQNEYSVEYKNDKWHGTLPYSVIGQQHMIKQLVKNGPFQVSFQVYQDFLSYKSGVYKHTFGSQLGGHAVKLIGYGTQNGQKFWLIANSWNQDWGLKGFFKIRRGTNQCGIESGGIAAQVKLK